MRRASRRFVRRSFNRAGCSRAVCDGGAQPSRRRRPHRRHSGSNPLDSAPSFGNGSEGDETVAGEIAVDLRDDASPADIADIGARYGLALRPNSAWSTSHDKLEVADVPPANEAAAIAALLGDPRVEHVEPMALYRASFVPNNPSMRPNNGTCSEWGPRWRGITPADGA